MESNGQETDSRGELGLLIGGPFRRRLSNGALQSNLTYRARVMADLPNLIDGNQAAIPKRDLRRLASYNSFTISFILHLILVIGLAIWFIPSGLQSGFDLVMSGTSEESLDFTLEDTAVNSLLLEGEELETPSTSPSTLTLDVESFNLSDQAKEWNQDPTGSRTRAQTVSAGSALRKSTGDDGSSFYGIEARGDRFVFVVDSSRSMDGKRWNSAKAELLRSLKELKDYQEFFVICFDFDARPVFEKAPPKAKFLNADDRTVGRVRNWLKQVKLGADTRPASSLAMAIAMKPDAIFLLSDGEIRDRSVLLLQQLNRNEDGGVKIPIHTISLLSTEGMYTLMQIANENNGHFTKVEQEPEP